MLEGEGVVGVTVEAGVELGGTGVWVSEIGVFVGEEVVVGNGVDVRVGVDVCVAMGVGDGVGVRVLVDVGAVVGVGVIVCVSVGVEDGMGVRVLVGVGKFRDGGPWLGRSESEGAGVGRTSAMMNRDSKTGCVAPSP